MREPVTTIGSRLAAFSGESVAEGGPSASAADTVSAVIAPASSTLAITRVGFLQNPGDPCMAPPSTWCCLSILLPMIVIAMTDAPSDPRRGISFHIMGVHSFQEAVRKEKVWEIGLHAR
jgi:hypothetical protein